VSAQAPAHVDCAWLLTDPGRAPAQSNMRIGLSGAHVASVDALTSAPSGPRRLVLPALCNAHDHARTFRSATLGAFEQPLEAWLPFLGVLPGVDPYLCAATSFARSLRNAVTRLMVHYTRVQGGLPYVEEALSVARAAHDVGVHIGFAVSMRDRNGIGLCEDSAVLAALRPTLRAAVAERLSVRAVSPEVQLEQVDALAQALALAPELGAHVTLQYGPAGVQWCSTPLLEAVAEASQRTGRPVHMHLLETRYQRAWADGNHPKGIVRYLDELGLLSPRLTLAHCTWARPEELELLAEREVTIAVNTSSNLGLKSGIAPLADMVRAGCRVAMGLDGMAFDEDDDALHEMRLAYALHRGWGFDVALTREQLWDFAARNGIRSVAGSGAQGDLRGGVIAPGGLADFVVLDWERLDDDTLFPDVDPLSLLLARARSAHIDQVVAGGRIVVRGGKLTQLDEEALRAELIERVRTGLGASGEWAGWQRQLSALAQDLAPFYRSSAYLGCC